MSRTLAHRPWIAWFDTPSNRIEEHHHEHGPCDLPPLSELCGHGAFLDGLDRRCRWTLDEHRLPNRCGCALCSGSWSRRMDRREDRHRSKLLLRTGRWRDECRDDPETPMPG